MQLTVQADLSLRVLMYLAERESSAPTANETRATVREISEHYRISYDHLVKVVHQLGRLGYLDTRKGKHGGISLARRPEAVNLSEVIRAVEPMALVECFDPARNTCPRAGACRLKGALAEAKAAFLDSLARYTLADLTALPPSADAP
jgi:Rrf2 family nitric oxide-sensitive transcriptional repressor